MPVLTGLAAIAQRGQGTVASIVIGGYEFGELTEFSYDSDILQLGDPFSVAIPNIDGEHSSKITLGQDVQFYLSDPAVNGGAKVQKVDGIVIGRELVVDKSGGSTLLVTGADRGWHLTQNSGPLWYRLRGRKFDALLNDLVFKNPSWGFKSPAKMDNEFNRKLKKGERLEQGRAQFVGEDASGLAIIPPIQFEPGETIAEVLIRYAGRERRLINVSADGYLQFYQPNYGQAISYTFDLHKSSDPRRVRNNVKRASLSEKADSIWTDVTCVSPKVIRRLEEVDQNNPNSGKMRGIYQDSSALPFAHRLTFSDSEPLDESATRKRARWKQERGIFDSWTLTYVVDGALQGSEFYEPDTMCMVWDDVTGVSGNYYISSIKVRRNRAQGTTTTLTVKKPNLLAAPTDIGHAPGSIKRSVTVGYSHPDVPISQ